MLWLFQLGQGRKRIVPSFFVVIMSRGRKNCVLFALDTTFLQRFGSSTTSDTSFFLVAFNSPVETLSPSSLLCPVPQWIFLCESSCCREERKMMRGGMGWRLGAHMHHVRKYTRAERLEITTRAKQTNKSKTNRNTEQKKKRRAKGLMAILFGVH